MSLVAAQARERRRGKIGNMDSAKTISVELRAAPEAPEFSRWGYVVRLLMLQAGFSTVLFFAPAGLPATASNEDDVVAVLAGKVTIRRREMDWIFDTVSLKREVDSGLTDAIGRFDEDRCPWPTEEPTAWAYAQQLRGQLAAAGVHPPDLPGRFRVLFTHDVDRTTDMEPTMIGKWFLGALGIRPSPMAIKHPFNPRRITRLVERLLDMEAEVGATSWTFCLSGPYSASKGGSRYDANWPSAQRLFRSLDRRGGHLGLHGSFYAGERDSYLEECLRLEKAAGKPITSHRNHYLRFSPLRIWSQLEKARISVDMSIGFVRRISFRAGLCHAYRPYNLLAERPSPIIEVPLLFMENHEYVEPRATLEYLLAQLRKVRDANGCVSILLHPDKIASDNVWLDFYYRLLRATKALGAQMDGQLPPMAPDQALAIG